MAQPCKLAIVQTQVRTVARPAASVINQLSADTQSRWTRNAAAPPCEQTHRKLLDLALQEVAGDLLPARTASTAFCYGRSRRARRAFEQRRRITRFTTARRNEDAGPRSSSLSLIDPSELKNLRGELNKRQTRATYGRRARFALYINEWPMPALSDFSFLTVTHLLE